MLFECEDACILWKHASVTALPRHGYDSAAGTKLVYMQLRLLMTSMRLDTRGITENE